MTVCKLYFNYAGYCTAYASHAVRGEPMKKIEFKAFYALVNHPEEGLILFDTGYTRRFYEETRSLPNKIYAWVTKAYIHKEEEVKYILLQNGIRPEQIRHIVISHFHADHIGGLKDFPNAQFHCSRLAYGQVKDIPDRLGFSKGILKNLIPDDFEERVKFIEDCNYVEDDSLGKMYDLYGDGSVLTIHLPGHAAGQIGVKVETTKKSYLLVADACWDIRAVTEGAMPHPIVRLFFDSWKDYGLSIGRLRTYMERFPEDKVIPSHCFNSYRSLVSHKIDWNAL